ncbi:MAG TPA: peptidoglycan-associated lipoprotein Pal [candidate division Zixibacteria bacterium]|nr:peptidoglycan-associated lipoprotein Pal [candidate division Zixibacteria bacterium]
MKKYILILISLFLFTYLIGCGKKPALKPAVEPPKTEAEAKTEETTPEPVQDEDVMSESGDLDNKVELGKIHFEFDKYRLTDEAKEILAANARVLKNNSKVRITIEGHCDERGTVEYNLALGERRAQAARDYLLELGVPASRISIISYGKERPLEFGQSESAWAKNRRDEFVVVIQ